MDGRSRAAFEQIFAPTFADLERVHKDYLELYEQVERRLPSFAFLSRPGTHWRGQHNYVNFMNFDDAHRFLDKEGRKGEKLHETLCANGFFVEYPAASEPPIAIIFRDQSSAEMAAQSLGIGPVRALPPPTVPGHVFPAIQDLVAFVQDKRIEYEPVRVRLRSLGRTLSEVPLGLKGDRFVRAVLEYFPDGTFKPFCGFGDMEEDSRLKKPFSSGATSILEALRDVEKPGASEDADLLNKSCSDAQWLLFNLRSHQGSSGSASQPRLPSFRPNGFGSGKIGSVSGQRRLAERRRTISG